VLLPSSVPVEYSGDGEPHAACKAEHLILHEWDFAMNAAHNADYAWEELQDIWPLLGDVHKHVRRPTPQAARFRSAGVRPRAQCSS
jgi:hypothetical protein